MNAFAQKRAAMPSPAIPAGVEKVDGPQKSFPDNMSVAPDVRGGGSISIGPDGMPQLTGPSDMMYRGPAPQAKPGQVLYKKGGSVGKASKASSRGDGIAQRGKTKGRMI
jgi:hypothetical protein